MKNFGWILCSMKTIGFFHAGQQNSIRSPWKYENHQDLKKKQTKKLSDSHQTKKAEIS
jgi:hypothetical protein